MPLLTLLTDFGTTDYYVAAVKGTVLRRAPGTVLVDVAHDVAPGDLAAGAFLLAASVPWQPAGAVHLAVVDPGVGSRRRILAARLAKPEAWVVVPDNGLLTHLLEGGLTGDVAVGGVWSVTRGDLFLPGPGSTFHGRDRFAPVAAHLLNGGAAEEIGEAIADPVRLPGEPRLLGSGRLVGSVLHIDRFGNVVTDLPTAWLPDGPCLAAVAGKATSVRASHYRELPTGEPGLLPGSLGTLELALGNGDLARFWQVERGARVAIRWPSDAHSRQGAK